MITLLADLHTCMKTHPLPSFNNSLPRAFVQLLSNCCLWSSHPLHSDIQVLVDSPHVLCWQ